MGDSLLEAMKHNPHVTSKISGRSGGGKSQMGRKCFCCFCGYECSVGFVNIGYVEVKTHPDKICIVCQPKIVAPVAVAEQVSATCDA